MSGAAEPHAERLHRTYLITVSPDDNGPRHRSELSLEKQTDRALEWISQRAEQRAKDIGQRIAQEARGTDGPSGE
jgi:hypothetical protein